MMSEKDIEDYVNDIQKELTSYVLVINEVGNYSLIENHYHFFSIIEDDQAAEIIFQKLIGLGIEVLTDDEFTKKYPWHRKYPMGFPEELKSKFPPQ